MKKVKRLLAVSGFLVLHLPGSTQLVQKNFNAYTPLRCEGEIPEDFRKTTKVKTEEDIRTELEISPNNYLSREKKDFFLQSNYVIDELLLGGKILFNDPVTRYVNRVADELLKEEPLLRSKIRIYCVKSNVTNAFATNQGIIFVTLGLLSRLENEAQLAYILSHEIVHFEKRHVINSFLKREQLATHRKNRHNAYDKMLETMSAYSHELEYEADLKGYGRFARSKYRKQEAPRALELLQYAYLPFEEITFDARWFLPEEMSLPPYMKLDTLRAVAVNSGYNDSKSSHPHLSKRIALLRSRTEELPEEGALFILPEEEFYTVREISRFESIRFDLVNRQYPEALYNCYVLLHNYPGNRYLETSMAHALYGIALYKTASRYYETTPKWEHIQGAAQQCYYFFQSLNEKEATALAASYLYFTSQKYPSELFTRDLLLHTLEVLIGKHKLDLPDFQEAAQTRRKKQQEALREQEKADSLEMAAAADESFLPADSTRSASELLPEITEPDRITGAPAPTAKSYTAGRVLKTGKGKPGKHNGPPPPAEEAFHLQVLSEYIHQPELLSLFGEAREKIKQQPAPQAFLPARRETRQAARKPKKLGIDKIVVVDPLYFKADDRKGLRLLDSEKGSIRFTAQLAESAKCSGLQAEIIHSKAYKPGDVEKYNHLAIMNDWMGERLNHRSLAIIPLESRYARELAKEYDTRFFCYTGVISLRQKRENRGLWLLSGVILYPALPYFWIKAFTPNLSTTYYTLIFDVYSGAEILSHSVSLNSRSHKEYISSLMYDLMLQVKNRP